MYILFMHMASEDKVYDYMFLFPKAVMFEVFLVRLIVNNY